MNREIHVRICGGLEVQSLRSTRQTHSRHSAREAGETGASNISRRAIAVLCLSALLFIPAPATECDRG